MVKSKKQGLSNRYLDSIINYDKYRKYIASKYSLLLLDEYIRSKELGLQYIDFERNIFLWQAEEIVRTLRYCGITSFTISHTVSNGVLSYFALEGYVVVGRKLIRGVCTPHEAILLQRR